ncbi:MAG: 6-bladed beta-propeller [Pedobacter agri]
MYNCNSGLLSLRTPQGKIIENKKIGFRGLEFVVLNPDLLVFSTGGLLTKDVRSNEFALSYIRLDGSFMAYGLPFKKKYHNINYTSPNRFSKNGEDVYFINKFETKIYQVKANGVDLKITLDFGSGQLKDSIMSQIRDLENYNFFPYVIDLKIRFVNSNYLFCSYLFQGKEGFILLDHEYKVLSQGTGSIISSRTNYLDYTPYCMVENTLIGIDYINILNNRKPVLVFYDLFKTPN